MRELTHEEGRALWEATPANTSEDNVRAFANFVFSVDPDSPRAMRVRFEDGTRQGRWVEDLVHDPEEAVEAAVRLDGTCDQYIIPNPLETTPERRMAVDDDVARLQFRLYDLDAKKVGDDLAVCGGQMESLCGWLVEHGHPKPLAAFTGNGYAVIERISEPNNQTHVGRARAVLNALARRWSCVDASTFNPARLFRFIGTTNMSYRSAGKDGDPKRSRLILPHDYTPREVTNA